MSLALLPKLHKGFPCLASAILLCAINPSVVAAQTPGNSSISAPLEATPQINQNTSGYILGPGDQLDITVLGYDEFTQTLVVLPDGTVTLPLIGSVVAAGQTVPTLTQTVTDRLSPMLISPVVTIQPSALRPILITVTGEVQRPGPLEIQNLAFVGNGGRNNQDDFQSQPTVSLAIAQAGGVTRNADVRDIILFRQLPSGEEEQLVVNLWETVSSESSSNNLIIRDGDSIFVPTLGPDDTFDRRLLASSSLAPDTIRVRVVGEVTEPGEVLVPPDSSISSAIAIAGGPTRDARLKKVAFIRPDEDGTVEPEILDLRALSDDYQVQEGDVVVVPPKRSTSILDFAASVLSPLGIIFNIVDDVRN